MPVSSKVCSAQALFIGHMTSEGTATALYKLRTQVLQCHYARHKSMSLLMPLRTPNTCLHTSVTPLDIPDELLTGSLTPIQTAALELC